ncbi:hypothetical protein P3T76_004883 [Phytophthora citrophthora]|uniref:Uncharacterized protein n=1 Tax=Phytophthora citrophthora TaxID=4793 RepID=A0AAD9GRH8_9STRA|nr:hypothetical protein P3T76_004883 [Phytophthora citrophthora]
MLSRFKFAFALTAFGVVFVQAALQDVPSFEVPSFDYGSLQSDDAPSRMLEALERGGIIALKNIPNYGNVRERFLTSAVKCAVASEQTEETTRYLSTKKFHDGTRRLTLRAAAGLELLETDSETLDAMAVHCPGHRELYEEFSGTLERAVDTFASTLDQSKFTMGDGERPISARKLIGDAKRLDHFHAYEAAQAPVQSNVQGIERDLSLAMHEDHGLFIAMAAPKFYSINNGDIRERRLKSDASGLVIGAADIDEIVRPELKADELVIMMGTGASRWLQTSHHLPAVMHGMRMPEELVEHVPGQRNIRAWFGKMTLLPSYQRLLATNMDFDEFTNRTTRHLRQVNTNDLKAIGCAGGRHLVESEGSCTFKICTVKPGIERPPTVGCKQACNYGTEFFDAKCAKKCDCTATTTQADVCWMLCVARLPVSECALEDQECSGLKMICTANNTDANTTTEAPVPTATSLATPLPATTPGTPASTTSTNATEVPVSTETPLLTVTPIPATVEPSTPLPTSVTTTPSFDTSPTTATPSIETPQPTAPPQPSEMPVKTQSPSATEDPLPATDEPVLPGGYC